jgi:excisionase family DNA binding protein
MHNDAIETASSIAIGLARKRGAGEVSADDLLQGGLLALSSLGVVEIAGVLVDLEALGLDWLAVPARQGAKVRYADDAVALFDRAARIAQVEREEGPRGPAPVKLVHLLAAVDWSRREGTLGKLAALGLNAAAWRHGLARLMNVRTGANEQNEAKARPVEREYLSPEEAAGLLGVHVQTIRGYIRSGKLPAARLAGERAIRIRATDLARVLEPLTEPNQES